MLPKRAARVLSGYTFLGDPVDVVETSRGCTFDCSFCSIIEMRGRNFYTREMARVIEDITDARDHGARVLFIVDDNVTLDVRRFEALCEAIIAAGLHDLRYIVQGMTSAFAAHGERLAPLMKRAGLRVRVPRHRERARGRPHVPEGLGQERAARGRPARRQRDAGGHRRPAPPRHLHRRRAHRRQPGRHGRGHRGQPGVRAQVRRLAVHPAPDAVSADADERGVPPARSHRQRAARGVRRHDGRRPQRRT